MALAISGLIWFESEKADEPQALAAAEAAAALFIEKGVDPQVAIEAMDRREAMHVAIMAWEVGKGEYPDGETDEDARLADVADLAWETALNAAGCNCGLIGYVAEFDGLSKEKPH